MHPVEHDARDSAPTAPSSDLRVERTERAMTTDPARRSPRRPGLVAAVVLALTVVAAGLALLAFDRPMMIMATLVVLLAVALLYAAPVWLAGSMKLER